MEERKQLNPAYGIGVFIFEMIVFIFVAAPIQMRFGMAGLAITELMLLAIAVGATLLFKQDLKEVFPIKKPQLRHIGGTLLIWCGVFIVSMIGTLIIAVIDPEGISSVSEGLSGMFTSVSFWISFVIVSLMPAVCEEALHRGFILHTFKNVKKEWVVVLAMGVIFGIFHLDLHRFFATAVLGAGMTYVMLKTKNFLMPMLYHAVNNLVPTLMSFSAMAASETLPEGNGTAVTLTRGMAAMSLGSYLMIGMTVPFLFLIGGKLLRPKEEKLGAKAVPTAAILSALLLAAGFLVMVVSLVMNPELQEIVTAQ